MPHFSGKGFDFFLGKKTYIMGILNITPDSFSDGGDFFSAESALNRASEIEAEGAHMIDIGAQSTRPGSTLLSPEEEAQRLLPALTAIKSALTIPVSVDTFYPSVAQAALNAGADIINDVTGFSDPAMISLAAKSGCGCIVMHPGERKYPSGVIAAVKSFFQMRANKLVLAGIPAESICLDPGIGFGKNMDECLELLGRTADVKLAGYAYLMAASRKRVIGYPSGNPPFKDRTAGTIAAHTVAQLGGADILRVHDVKEAVQAALVTDAIKYGFRE